MVTLTPIQLTIRINDHSLLHRISSLAPVSGKDPVGGKRLFVVMFEGTD